MPAAPTRLLAALSLLILPLAASAAPFQVSGNLPGVVLQPLAGARGAAFITSIVHAGDDRLFLTFRDGRVKIYSGGLIEKPFLDLRGLVGTEGEGGLLSIAFHPRYSENGLFFVNYTDLELDTVIARYQVSAQDPNRADPASRRVLLEIDQPFSNHKGGQIQFGPDGYLYIGMGDGGAAGDPECRAQRNDTLLGKLLRIDVDRNASSAPFYGIPPDNPFRGADSVPDEVWARGLRNPYRFSFDRATGDLYLADVGQNQREEIDLQPAGSRGGENYGWKVMEGTLCFNTQACPASTPPCNSAALTMPILEYSTREGRNCSAIGGFVYRGSRMPQLRGTYLFGDFCSAAVWGARRRAEGGYEVRKLADGLIASGLPTFGEDRQGEVYLATIDEGLFRLGPPRRPDRVALYDPRTSVFHVKPTLADVPEDRAFRFGPRNSPYVPLAGDWDGDGRDTIGFWDPAQKMFRLKNSLTGGKADILFRMEQAKPGWLPVAGDWDGDGKDGIGFYEPSTAIFRVRNTLSAGNFAKAFRLGGPRAGLVPLAGDWDGDGKDTAGLFDPADAAFRLRNSLTDGGPDIRYDAYKGLRARPIVGDWDGDGVETPALFNVGNAAFFLSSRYGQLSSADFTFGTPNSDWLPIAGSW